MSARPFVFVVPGSLEARTGGSIYDRRMVEGLRRLGWAVTVRELGGRFPDGDVRARAALAEALAQQPDGALVCIDFLAAAGLPEVVRDASPRLALLSLVHLLPSDEPFISREVRQRRQRLERETLAASAGLIATSPSTAERMRSLGIDARRMRTVIPGTQPAMRAIGPAEGEPPRILCLASVTPGKGQAVLAAALIELADIPWTCVCAGSLTRSPAYAGEVVATVGAAGLSERVAFPGECDQGAVEELYRTSSMFVMPSFFESYGMVLTEAMAHGLPIVGTTTGAIPETVPAGAGILVAPGDGPALARVVRSLLQESPEAASGQARAMRDRLGDAAYGHASTLPDWDEAASTFAEALIALEAAAP